MSESTAGMFAGASSAIRLLSIGLGLVIVGLWVAPWLARLSHPSLLTDDLIRLILLQRHSFSARLVIPFNEHLSPLFEVVSTVAWSACGMRLERAPLVFGVAGLVPFFGCLAALFAWVRNETGSRTTAGAAVTLFACSPSFAEVVTWYSASGFCWALLPTLIALTIAARSGGRPGGLGRLAIVACCLVAPMGSGVGLFAGPALSARLACWEMPTREGLRPWLVRMLRGGEPLLGTLGFLAIGGLFGLDEALSESVSRNRDLLGGLASVAEAPGFLVLGGMLGIGRGGDAVRMPPTLALWLVSAAGTLAALIGWARADGQGRARLAAAAALILIPYAVIFCVRVQVVGAGSLLHNTRYHLFPAVGVVLLASLLVGRWLRKLDGRPIAARLAVLGLAAGMVVAHGEALRDHRWIFRFPDQPGMLRALDRLADAAREQGIPRDRVVRAFDPVVPRWSFPGGNVLELLPETAAGGQRGGDEQIEADAWVREVLLARLPIEDRSALLGGLDASAYLVDLAAEGDRPIGRQEAPGRLSQARQVRPDPEGSAGRYHSAGWPGFIEFAFEAGTGPASALVLPPIEADQPLQLWWIGADGSWSASRSVTIAPPLPRPTVLRLADLPHWDGSDARAVRLVVPKRGLVAVDPPTLLR